MAAAADGLIRSQHKMPAGRGPAGKETTMSKKSTKTSAKANKKSNAGTGKSTKRPKPANERILEKFQRGDIPAAQPAIEEPVPEATTAATVAPTGHAVPASANDTTKPADEPTGEPGATGGKRMGLVSAAIRVLEDAGEDAAMNCHELVKLAAERGFWQPRAGKTPANTLYAALLREVRDKGAASRFRKTDRGKFALNKTS